MAVQNQRAELFQTSFPNVSMRADPQFAEGDLQSRATVKEFLTVRQDGSRQVLRSEEHYNLDVIISVGYRVKSHRGIQFRHLDYSAAARIHRQGIRRWMRLSLIAA